MTDDNMRAAWRKLCREVVAELGLIKVLDWLCTKYKRLAVRDDAGGDE